ncbi:MAG: ammonium transporter, partial [Acidimicrobiales bacterium]
GMVRAKNVLGMLMQNFFCMGLVSVLWVLIGFTLAFGDDHGGLIGGFRYLGLSNLNHALPGFHGATALHIPLLAFVSFQMMFAIITPALITGATADRLRFGAFALLIGIWAVVVYAPVAHWVFSPNGWLNRRGALDFAGGTVVHVNAGIAALAVVLVIGRRKGWPKEAMPPHSLPFTLLGAGILWFGWFGFNAGSALGANGVAAQALINTQVAAAAALLSWLVVERIKDHRATTLGAASGAVAGLVAITPCAGYVNAMGAIAIGLVAGALCFAAISLKFKFGYDDALDVVGVHLLGGIAGSLLVGILATKSVNPQGANGLLAGGGLHLLGEQALAVGVTLVFSFVVTFALAKAIDATIGLRVSRDDEAEGLDATQHAESAYNLRELGSIGRIG